ncbi:MAG: hypothetical protein HGA87_01905 [Desulfobulbaceae bacterium]|nr:hypothetical protein [Desulfobulbaceae bacterium]
MNMKIHIQDKPLTPLKSIRKHCLGCGGRPKEVRHCSNTACHLYQFRLGNNPSRKGVGPGRIIKADPGAKKNDLTGISRGIGVREGLDMAEGQSFDNGPFRRELQLVQMESAGKVKMVGRRIIIELTQD